MGLTSSPTIKEHKHIPNVIITHFGSRLSTIKYFDKPVEKIII